MSVSLVREKLPAGEIVRRIAAEASERLRALGSSDGGKY